MEYKIRKAVFSDLKRIIYTTKLAWKVPYNKLGFVNNFNKQENLESLFLEKKIEFLVAILNDKIVGSLCYEYSKEKEIYFSKLSVLKKFRNKGIATALTSKLESIAKKQKIRKITIDIMEEKFLLPFYQGLGFKSVKKTKYVNHNEISMVKLIK